jgi:hypothetical protein
MQNDMTINGDVRTQLKLNAFKLHDAKTEREIVRTDRTHGDKRKRNKNPMEEEDWMAKENVELSTEDATGKTCSRA